MGFKQAALLQASYSLQQCLAQRMRGPMEDPDRPWHAAHLLCQSSSLEGSGSSHSCLVSVKTEVQTLKGSHSEQEIELHLDFPPDTSSRHRYTDTLSQAKPLFQWGQA